MTWMPTIEQYMALAEALHDEDDFCNPDHAIPFGECVSRQWDIQHAVEVLQALHKSDWNLLRVPVDVVPLFPVAS